MGSTPPGNWTESDIEAIVADYLKNAKPLFGKLVTGPTGVNLFPEENLVFNSFGQQQFLIINRIPLHELPVRLLQRLPIYLTRQFEVQVEIDSKFYWALTHDVFRQVNRSHPWPLQESFDALIASMLAHLGQAPSSREIWILNRVIHEIIPPEVDDLVRANTIVAMYLSYPIVEGLAKYHLRDYIDIDGKIIRELLAGAESFKLASQVSNLGRLLRGLQAAAGPTLGKPDLGRDMADLALEIEAAARRGGAGGGLGGGPWDPWDWIYGLRNDLLHGAAKSPLRSGLLTNLACLLLWHSVAESDLSKALERIKQSLPMRNRLFGGQMFGEYYPPFG